MDYREEFEETVDQDRSDTVPGVETGTERPTDNRPPVLRPEVVTRGGVENHVENPFDGLARGLPDVVQRAKGFYSKHPTLVKAIGTVVVAGIARRLFRGRPGLF